MLRTVVSYPIEGIYNYSSLVATMRLNSSEYGEKITIMEFLGHAGYLLLAIELLATDGVTTWTLTCCTWPSAGRAFIVVVAVTGFCGVLPWLYGFDSCGCSVIVNLRSSSGHCRYAIRVVIAGTDASRFGFVAQEYPPMFLDLLWIEFVNSGAVSCWSFFSTVVQFQLRVSLWPCPW